MRYCTYAFIRWKICDKFMISFYSSFFFRVFFYKRYVHDSLWCSLGIHTWREVLIDKIIVLRPGARNTISAAAWAASDDPSTAIPQSAFLREGASFTPIEVVGDYMVSKG